MPSQINNLCLEHSETIAKHEERLNSHDKQISELKETINYRKLLIYQILGTILSGVTTSVILNMVLK